MKVLIIILFSIPHIFCAQNLIHNGDFEIMNRNYGNNVIGVEGDPGGPNYGLVTPSWRAIYGWNCPSYKTKIKTYYWTENFRDYQKNFTSYSGNAFILGYKNLTLDSIKKVNENRDSLIDKIGTFSGKFNDWGIYQKLGNPLKKDSWYTVSFRFKIGLDRDPDTFYLSSDTLYYTIIYRQVSSGIDVLFTTYEMAERDIFNQPRPIEHYYTDSFPTALKDTVFDKSYQWRLIEHTFKADSAYEYINIAQFQHFWKTKFYIEYNGLYDKFSKKGRNVIRFYSQIDDVRLLPYSSYLKISKDSIACIGDTVTLKVISGKGTYKWYRSNNPTNILSTDSFLKVKVADTQEMYFVSSPFDTASVMVYSKQKYYEDTISITNCENNPLKISNAKIVLWNDNQKDTIRYIDKAGFYWYETKNNCEIHRTNINLNIIKVSNDTLKAETCNTYNFGDSTYSKSGTYTHKYIAKNGCDSFRTLVLTSKEVTGKIKLENGINYTALTPNASYQWYYCYPWRRITNAQNQTFSTTTKGSYAVIVSSLGCTDTSDCVALYSSGIQSLNPNNFQIYPNPIQDNFTIQFGNEYKENSVEIYNALGQKIKSFNTKLNEIQVEMKDESRGIYLIKVNEIQVYKIIKE
jgi:hypothetical protein